MKKMLSVLGLLLMTVSLYSQTKATQLGQATRQRTAQHQTTNMRSAKAADPYELLGCPDGTVYGGEHTADAGYSGFGSADLGRTDGYATEFYQHFSNCYYSFNGVRFVGVFNYWNDEEYNWFYCNERGGIDDNGEMTKPIRFIISFFKEGEDGNPGEKVYSKEFDIIGENTGVQVGDYSAGFGDVYSFSADLGTDIKLEHGFMQINAVDMGDKPSCWFSLFTSDASVDYALQHYPELDMWSGQLPTIFCFKGNGDYNTSKGLKITRILSPKTTSTGKYEKVQIEVSNVGPSAVNDAAFELWLDDKCIAKEELNTSIEPMGKYKYTFVTPVDCSAIGEHKIFVKNVTPGDELLSGDGLSIEVTNNSGAEYGESYSEVYSYEYISNVKFGTIDNTTEGSTYSDFTDMKAELTPGAELDLAITTEGGPDLAAWIDWNSNHVFESDEKITFDSYDYTVATAKLKIPAKSGVTPGEKRMRIIAEYGDPKPVGDYTYGETEDYTIVVKYGNNSAQSSYNIPVIDEEVTNSTKDVAIETSNVGDAALQVSVKCNYVLPNAPTSHYSANVPAKHSTDVKPCVKAKSLKAAGAETKTADDVQYVLKYDNGMDDAIGISNSDESTYANLYPGNMLSAISGMKISSVDVFVYTAAQENSIVIYEQNSQNELGTLLVEQKYVPQENAWNHIVLDNPITIEGKDLAVGAKFKGITPNSYYIGTDNGDAVVGFGDIVNIGGKTWWSMADLGINSNYCVRANVTGTPTPAISWLTLDKKEYTVQPGANDKLQVNINTKELSEGLYNANLIFTSNDPINSMETIPVYVINGSFANVNTVHGDKASVNLINDELTVTGDKQISNIAIYGMNGTLAKRAQVNATDAKVSVNGLDANTYIIVVNYADNTRFAVKFIAK